jgi:hypothetical protein
MSLIPYLYLKPESNSFFDERLGILYPLISFKELNRREEIILRLNGKKKKKERLKF